MSNVKCLIEGRQTRMGALTQVKDNPNITIDIVSESKTGNHWTELVSGKDGTQFEVIDISNSGKHNCFIATLDNKEIDNHHRVFSQNIPCEICQVN
ncbi:hypothetical protein LCGC14_0548670 [marine sediment metagenome]|uniref:Uncharacterized protein n=1 Tax=marine sediment metagenome TaxID=412755 RepID=A0A0F9S961_9ZZZZ